MPLASGKSQADYHTRRANNFVANCMYHSDVDLNGDYRADFGAPAVGADNNIMSGVDIAAVVTRGGAVLSTFNAENTMGPFGRNITVKLSGAGTPTVTVRGRDYLGQPMAENIVGTGATAAAGKKAFYFVDNVTTSAGVAATTLGIGTGNIFGLPFATLKLTGEYASDAVPAAGALVVALAPGAAQSLTSNDPRGTYAPATTPDGAKWLSITGTTVPGQLYGAAHFYS